MYFAVRVYMLGLVRFADSWVGFRVFQGLDVFGG